MTREIQPDYETQYLFPRSLEEWVGPEHPARFIREFVDALDLSGLESEQNDDERGRPHYGASLLTKVWLYGYTNRIRSSRALEKACRDVLPLVWLAGTHVPDHNTLWRFWKRHREAIRRLFLQSVRVAVQENLVGMVMHAVDGTKIKSAASKRSAWHAADLERLLGKIDGEIAQLEEQISQAGAAGDGTDDTLPETLRNRHELRARIKRALAVLEQEDRKHMHPHDPDAQMMVSGGRVEFAYNAQAVVDSKTGVIVAADVTDEPNDEKQLEPMLEQVEQNTSEFAAVTVADSGYHTSATLGAAAAMGAEVVVATPIRDRHIGPFHTLRFTHDEASDSVICPRGEHLTREGLRRHRNKPHALKTYRCRVAASCPVASECSRDPKGRVIEISPHHAAVIRNRQYPDARSLLIGRQSVVERAFAEIKETLGLRRWTLRGLENVKLQWLMMCAAMNVRRILAGRGA